MAEPAGSDLCPGQVESQHQRHGEEGALSEKSGKQ